MARKVAKATPGTSATGEQGFTLLELLVVLFILVLMAGLFPWALNRAIPARRAEAAAQTAASAMRYAQSFSIASGRDVRMLVYQDHLKIDSASRRWNLPAATTIAPVGVASSHPANVVFHPDGSSAGAVFEVGAVSRKAVLRVSSLTGRVTLERR